MNLKNINLKTKLLAIFLATAGIITLIIGFSIWNHQHNLLDSIIEDNMKSNINNVEAALNQKSNEALAISYTIANTPQIIEAAETENRGLAMETIIPTFTALEEEFDLSVIHFRSPADTSFLRAHNPDNWGDTTTRSSILDVAESGETRQGFIEGAYGMGMRGWSPVIADNEVIGTLESNINFSEEILTELSQNLDVELKVYLPENETDYDLLASTTDLELNIDSQLLNQAREEISEVAQDQDTAYAFLPIRDYDGEVLTIIGVFEDISEYNTLITSSTFRLIITILIIGLLSLIPLYYILQRSLKPVDELVNIAKKVTEGNLTVRATNTDRSDEIGILAKAFNSMIDELRDIVEGVTQSARETSAASEELAAQSEEGNASIQQIKNATSEFASTTEELSNSSQEIAEATDTVNDLANDSLEKMELTEAQMQEIITSAEKANQTIQQLDTSSQEIQNITEVIADIAEQTNLLALNAAIEAARAGEEGQGFAVVAEEVRELAVQTQESITQIEKVVKQITADTKKAVEVIEDNNKEISQGATTLEEASSFLQEIVEQIGIITDRIQGIANANQELTASSQEILANTEDQSTLMEELSSSTEELTAMAEELSALVEQLQV
ncbi:methyl-accepting chemotaxis protein [Fuchsiella alkaliacetigena]|uniref:methyl-accepting chemotaxis protein n=1 Tax=Fuchsiella alkaliacetigena TaxID=957042 RepID=UPI00200A1B18|nr:methyl-accepting chemotaxis protein [Fuchsiella alkaliacetigena]MCK8825841.1 methyl-accepting chemotaxis protein [Fuchsiella alkaliacetigena]